MKPVVIVTILATKGQTPLCLQGAIEVYTIQPGLKDLHKTDKLIYDDYLYDDISFALALNIYSHSLSK